MPAPLDVDREAVKAHAITHGIREAARAFGLSEGTVTAWSTRERWLAPPQTIVHQLPITVKPRAVTAVKASVAARNAMNTLSAKSKLNLAIAVAKGAKKAKRMSGAEIIAKSDKLKALADTGDKIHQWSAQTVQPVMRLELIAGAVGQSIADELPAIDVEAEVLPSNELKGIQGVDESTQDQND